MDPPPPGEEGRELTMLDRQTLEDAFRDTIPAASRSKYPTDSPLIRPGYVVYVGLDYHVWRPVMVVEAIYDEAAGFQRVSGFIFCQPEDHNTPALRGMTAKTSDPARFHGRPDRYTPFAYCEAIPHGDTVGSWRPL